MAIKHPVVGGFYKLGGNTSAANIVQLVEFNRSWGTYQKVDAGGKPIKSGNQRIGTNILHPSHFNKRNFIGTKLTPSKARNALKGLSAVNEAVVTTGESHGHTHTIDTSEESGLTSEDNGHSHPYTLGNEMTDEGGEDDHTHDIPAIKEGLDEGVVGGLVFNSRRDEQWFKRQQETIGGAIEKMHEEDEALRVLDEQTFDMLEAVTGKFTSAQLLALKKAYKNIKKIDPASKALKGIIGLLDLMTDEQLQQIADSSVNFVSGLAQDRLGGMKEEVAANFAGGDPNPNVAGLDEPPVQKKKKKRFGEHEVFEVDSETFSKSVKGKPKFARFKNFMSLDDFPNIGQDIKEFSARNPRKAIVLKDSRTGRMLFLKGKR